PRAIAVDATGTVYVAGDASSPEAFGYVCLAYSSTGVPLWTNRYGPTNSSYILGFSVLDSEGRVYVFGSGTDSTIGQPWATVAYSSSGNTAWTNRYNETGLLAT